MENFNLRRNLSTCLRFLNSLPASFRTPCVYLRAPVSAVLSFNGRNAVGRDRWASWMTCGVAVSASNYGTPLFNLLQSGSNYRSSRESLGVAFREKSARTFPRITTHVSPLPSRDQYCLCRPPFPWMLLIFFFLIWKKQLVN